MSSKPTKSNTSLLYLVSWDASERPAFARDGDPAQGDHPFLAGVSPRGQPPPGTAGPRREGLM